MTRILEKLVLFAIAVQAIYGIGWMLLWIPGEPLMSLVYHILLLVLGAAGAYFLCRACAPGQWIRCYIGAAMMMSSPFVLPGYFMEYGKGFSNTCLIFMLGLYIWAKREKSLSSVCSAMGLQLIFWVLAFLQNPEYILFGIPPITAALILGFARIWKYKAIEEKIRPYIGVLVLLMLGILTISMGGYLKYQKTAPYALESYRAHRIMSTETASTFGSWPKEMQELFTQQELAQVLQSPEAFRQEYYPRFWSQYQEKQGKQLLKEAVVLHWNNCRPMILRDMRNDLLILAAPNLGFLLQKSNPAGPNQLMGHYYEFRKIAPVWSSEYMNYSHLGLGIGLVCGVLLMALKRRSEGTMPVSGVLLWGLLCCLQMGFYFLISSGNCSEANSIFMAMTCYFGIWFYWRKT